MATTRSKPSSFFCKIFIIVLVLLTIPLFPSQAPEFTTFSTIFTKLWEPLQLLFVGLAICYGLFCKRSSTNLEVKNEGSDLDFSGFLDMSSFFEDGVQNSCGYDEKGMILDSENGSKITRGWNSKYFPGEAKVVVANLDEWGEPVSKRECKPLNLPVRSLRSNIVVDDKEEKCTLDAPLKVRGVRPMNLEKKFDEVSSPAPGSWQARSCMMETKDGTRRDGESSRLRPHSAGEFDFDRFELKSSSLGEISHSQMEMEDMDRDIDLKSSNMEVSVPRVAKSNESSRVLLRGKSVRTIRSCKVVPYEMEGSNTEVYSQTKDSSFLNHRGHENRESQSEDKDDSVETSSITSRDNSESESESYSSSPDEEVARSDIDGSEVDRKAGEFIARFREQIRLQKLASAKRPGHSGVS